MTGYYWGPEPAYDHRAFLAAQSAMYARRKDIDPHRVKVGECYEICFGDTGATCVYSCPVIVARDAEGLWFKPLRSSARHDRPKDIDGCYTWLERPRRTDS